MDNRPAKQLWLPFEIRGGLFTSKADTASPVEDEQIMEDVVDRYNLLMALSNLKRNGGAPGVDGMTVEELPEYLKREWPKIRGQLLDGSYEPRPVKRVEIPKPGEGESRGSSLSRFNDTILSIHNLKGAPLLLPRVDSGIRVWISGER